jgi:DNA-binding XRE family transcriptional regulator
MATARERAGLSQDALAHTLGVTAKTIGHWEGGHSTPRPALRLHLAKLLGFTMDELTRRLGLDIAPDQAALNGASAGAFASITEWLSMLVRAEQSAYAIWTLDTHAFPALCQTAGYARIVEKSGHWPFTPEEVDELVRKRLDRAAVLDRADYTALIAAPLLDAVVGNPDVMADQFAHLLALADRPNIVLQIIDVDHLFAAPGRFTLLATAGPDPDMAAESGVRGPTYTEGAAATAEYVRLFNHLASKARDPEASRAAITRSADRFAALAATIKRGNP